jgi:hypothetical protein
MPTMPEAEIFPLLGGIMIIEIPSCMPGQVLVQRR